LRHSIFSIITSAPEEGIKMSSATGMNKMKKNTANTVFFRYSPSESSITRKHFETYFSDIGPVKKCSLIRTNKNKDDDGKRNREAKGYGFCKFTSQDDSINAAKTLNEKVMELEYGLKVKVWVEVADSETSNSNSMVKKNKVQALPSLPDGIPTADSTTTTTEDLLQLQAKKRTSRVILRNLSFYATEHNIRQVMEEKFGEVVDINLPLVPNLGNDKDDKAEGAKKKRKQLKQHRGFAFVTFANQKSAHKAVEACASGPDGQILIKKRPVAIDFSVSKFQHRRMIEEEKETGNEGDDNESSSENENDEENSDKDANNENDSSDTDDKDDDDDNNTESDSDDSDTDIEDEKNTKLVKSNNKYSLFLRNLPFDTTRHDLFTLFAKYGHIDSIYVVKDQTTGLTKGTAFVNFSKEGGYMRALEASHDGDIENTYDFKSGKNIMTSLDGGSSGGLFLRGRRILIDKAVDKNTAESLKVERDEDGKPVDKKTGKDKRNLYLKGEGRVAEGLEDSYNVDAWENLPQGDQFKRGRAHQEKHTKLRSPLFFINPYRLSLRNLAKNVDESQLKLMVAAGIKNGLEKNLVTKDDIIAHWRAGGEMTTRDIIEKQKALEEDGDNDGGIIPPFDESDGIKKFIPSVFIDRDFQSKDAKVSKTLAPSRGFGFAEFTHHAHALACLRELNNNIAYAAEFVAGGKRALEMKKHAATRKKKKQKKDLVGDDDGAANDGFIGEDGKVRIPRLLVEFTVENKAKARMQAERKAQQQANVQKQRVSAKQSKGKKDKEKRKEKKGRGAQQREKKRKRKEQGLPEKDDSTLVVNATKKQKLVQKDNVDETNDTLKKKSIKPQKKKKIDNDESAFEDMVQSYKEAFRGGETAKVAETKNERSEITQKRWFE